MVFSLEIPDKLALVIAKNAENVPCNGPSGLIRESCK